MIIQRLESLNIRFTIKYQSTILLETLQKLKLHNPKIVIVWSKTFLREVKKKLLATFPLAGWADNLVLNK